MGTLYVVATPIGNLEDMTFRAIEVLKKVDTIFCEDTRVTKKLLSHYDIKTDLVSYHGNSSDRKIQKGIKMLEEGKDIALVSDAGTPTISDPGVKFVRTIRDNCPCEVFAIPGASAVTAALSASGAPASSFVFLGFSPRKKGRETFFKEVSNEKKTVVFYESPHRLMKTLEALPQYLSPNREVIVAREISKVYESYITGTADEVLEHFKEAPDEVRGEIVIILSALLKIDDPVYFDYDEVI